MALITITGYPCSGKSKRTQQLKEYVESKLADQEYRGPTLKVVLLSDDNLNLSRSVYDGICAFVGVPMILPCRQKAGLKSPLEGRSSLLCRGRWDKTLS
jgi:hypothetical protein